MLLLNLALDYIEQHNKVIIDKSQTPEILKDLRHFGNLEESLAKFSRTKKNDDTKNKISHDESNLPENLIEKISAIGISNSQNTTNAMSSNKPLIQEINCEPVKAIVPEYNGEMVSTQDCGANSSKLLLNLKINLPKICSVQECDLNVDAVKKSLILNTTNADFYKQLVIELAKYEEQNRMVDIANINAKFVKKERILKIKIPILEKILKS